MNRITSEVIDKTALEKVIHNLSRFRKQNDTEGFNREMQKMLPEVKIYLSKRLAAAISRGVLPKGKYKVDDFIDQLYIEAFDLLGKENEPKSFYPWLFKKADELFEDTLTDEEFDDFFFKEIEEYTKEEWEEMEEKFSADGDGDLVMMEELDDISYKQNQYTIEDVFIEDKESDMIKKLDKELSEQQLAGHFTIALSQLPLLALAVLDLDVSHGFNTSEIAMIKGMEESKVIQMLENTKRVVKTSLIKRFSIP